MKLNKKGFTLIELLAVVVILLALTVMAVSSISAAIERNKDKQDKAKEKIIKEYVKLYTEEHGGNCASIDDLITEFSLDKETDLKKSDNTYFSGTICNDNE